MKKRMTTLMLGLGILVYTCTSISADIPGKTLSSFEKGKPKIKYVQSDNDSVDFTMKIPDYMQATSSLDEGRPFQYMHEVNEHYLVASYETISDVKVALESFGYSGENFLDQYVAYNKDVIGEAVSISSQKPVKKLTIDGMKAQMLQFDGMVAGIDYEISYFLSFIEGPENVYFVMAWTLASEKETFTPIADTMIKSFRRKKK